MTSGLALPFHQATASYCHGGHEEISQILCNGTAYDVPHKLCARSSGVHAIPGTRLRSHSYRHCRHQTGLCKDFSKGCCSH